MSTKSHIAIFAAGAAAGALGLALKLGAATNVSHLTGAGAFDYAAAVKSCDKLYDISFILGGSGLGLEEKGQTKVSEEDLTDALNAAMDCVQRQAAISSSMRFMSESLAYRIAQLSNWENFPLTASFAPKSRFDDLARVVEQSGWKVDDEHLGASFSGTQRPYCVTNSPTKLELAICPRIIPE